jgi:hypothetical protein
MPYFIVGKKELRESALQARLLEKLLREDAPLSERKSNRPLALAKEYILENGWSFLVSVDRGGAPKAYLAFSLPESGKKRVNALRFFTSKRFRSRDSEGSKRKGGGGEQKRLFYRLVAIARRQGIEEIYAGALDWRIAEMFSKLAGKPRLDTGRLGLKNIRERLKAWNETPIETKRARHTPETIRMTKPKMLAGMSSAAISIRQRKPRQRRARH